MLKIEKIPLHVAVFEGTSDLLLNRGVGRVKETEKIGGLGNIGIAGHRDGFFRHLGTIVKGDQIQLVTPKTTYTYLVDKILIVTPTDYMF
jgi:sortase A